MHRYGESRSSSSSSGTSRYTGKKAPKLSLSQMSRERFERQRTGAPSRPPLQAPPRPAAPLRPNDPLAEALIRLRAEDLAASKKRLEEKAAADRAARVREEEQRSLLKKLEKVPAAKRDKFLEEERVIAMGREAAAKLKKQTPKMKVDLGAMFGIDLDEE